MPPELQAFEPEFNWTYEVGLKSDWYDGRLRVNLAAFYIDLDGIQISAPVPGSPNFAVQNAGTGTSTGFEVEISAQPIDELTLNLSYALASSEFDDAVDGSLQPLVDAGLLPSIDVSGQQLPRASEHTLNGSVTWQQPVWRDFDGYVRLGGRYESEQKAFTSDALERVGDRINVSLRAGLVSETLEVVAFVDTLTGDETPVIAASTLFLGGTLGPTDRGPTAAAPQPRRFGVTATWRF